MGAELLTDLSRATDANGNPLPGAKWYFYATGTTTPMTVYTNAALSIEHANPVVADGGGKFPAIYFDSAAQYRAVLKDANDNPIPNSDIDPVNLGGGAAGSEVIDDGLWNPASPLIDDGDWG